MNVYDIFRLQDKKVFVTENGKNIEVMVKSAKVYAVGQEEKIIKVDYKCLHNDEEIIIQRRLVETPFFATKEDLLGNGNPIPHSTGSDFALNFLTPKAVYSNNHNGLHCAGWVIENGLATRKDNISVEYFIRDYENGTSIAVLEDKTITDIYDTRDECEAYSEISVTKYDGTKEIIGNSGYMGRMTTYTEEQIAVIKQMQELLDKSKELGLTALNGYSGVGFINTTDLNVKNVRDAEWDYGMDIKDAKLEVYWSKKILQLKGIDNNFSEEPIVYLND